MESPEDPAQGPRPTGAEEPPVPPQNVPEVNRSLPPVRLTVAGSTSPGKNEVRKWSRVPGLRLEKGLWGGEAPETPEDPRRLPNKRAPGHFLRGIPKTSSAPLGRRGEAAQTRLLAPGAGLVPADLLKVLTELGWFLGGPQGWVELCMLVLADSLQLLQGSRESLGVHRQLRLRCTEV